MKYRIVKYINGVPGYIICDDKLIPGDQIYELGTLEEGRNTLELLKQKEIYSNVTLELIEIQY